MLEIEKKITLRLRLNFNHDKYIPYRPVIDDFIFGKQTLCFTPNENGENVIS